MNASTLDRGCNKCYALPLFSIMGRTIRKSKEDKEDGTMVPQSKEIISEKLVFSYQKQPIAEDTT